ncbi:MAG: aspartate ammonia-lyase [Oleiphilus sp.]|nr:MAG: aspartate ammonia-lyase [Oleiphilus sp.]
MSKYRIERDSLGELEVPETALYGIQTQRAIHNFPISGRTLPKIFIESLIKLKSAAASANSKLGCLDKPIAKAIIAACRQLLDTPDLMRHFPVDVFQTGSGTSTNMNANEVIARLAAQHFGGEVHPNDHVNYGQSSNDVIPSVIHISAAIVLEHELLPALNHLNTTIRTKAKTLTGIYKTGRTHLMDAVPLRFDATLSAWAQQLDNNRQMLVQVKPFLHQLALGGTAVGNGINTDPGFGRECAEKLSTELNLSFTQGRNLYALISTQDTAVSLSGQLKSLAVSLMKIANDLRWMNSGPLAGLGEISLTALQPGSSIMPGKVNPVIPESAAMVAAQVIGNDAAITVAGQSGNFELNVMLPLIAYNLLDSLCLLSRTCRILADKAVADFTVNQKQLKKSLSRNPILATALNPIIGYEKAAEIAKRAYLEERPVVEVAAEMTDISREEIEILLAPQNWP